MRKPNTFVVKKKKKGKGKFAKSKIDKLENFVMKSGDKQLQRYYRDIKKFLSSTSNYLNMK